ncbi:MAG: helix-turn-helix transcriptional regulator [Acidobacteriota bacterium]|nr:helix-turn-helix transcriptional regulator [Acidobacteriota bacterium]
MTDAATLIAEARREAGLSLRALAERADVCFTTVFRIEHGELDPTTGTLRKLLGALGQELELGRSSSAQGPQLAELSDAWSTDRAGQDQPDWTRLRAFLDHLARHPDEAAQAIRSRPPASGSAFFDNLLAAIAEKVSDDSGTPRPAWTKRIPPLAVTWEGFGTPRMAAAAAAATPPQLACRKVLIPAASLWRQTR